MNWNNERDVCYVWYLPTNQNVRPSQNISRLYVLAKNMITEIIKLF